MQVFQESCKMWLFWQILASFAFSVRILQDLLFSWLSCKNLARHAFFSQPGVWKLLVSFSVSSTVLFFTFSAVSDLRSFNISLWDARRRVLISEAISSFEEALKLSKEVFSILGDFGLDGPATSISWFEEREFFIFIGGMKPPFTMSSVSRWVFFLFWLLVVDILM